MSSLISSSCLIQVAMLRMCFGLIFVGLAVTAHTAQSEDGSFAPDLDILTIQPVHSDAGWLLPYRLKVNIALTRPDDTAIGSGLSNTPQLHLIDEPKKETVWLTDARWQGTPNRDHVSLSPILRFESKGEMIEIRPRLHSVWVGWRQAFP